MANQTIKQDAGKPRWEIVPMKALEGIALNMQDAIEPCEAYPDGRYEIHSWQQVDPLRYFGAMVRHITDLQTGEAQTTDTLQHHIDCILTNAMFISWALKNGYDVKNFIPIHPTKVEPPVPTKEELEAEAVSLSDELLTLAHESGVAAGCFVSNFVTHYHDNQFWTHVSTHDVPRVMQIIFRFKELRALGCWKT